MSHAIAVEIADTQDHVRVDAERLTEIARQVLRLHKVERAEITVALVDDAAIRRVHARHLDDDTPTDVITFDLTEAGSDLLVGEIVISAETAKRVAMAESIAPDLELTLYLIHGLLHLRGYDDLDPANRAKMRAREAEVMATLGLEHPGADPGRFSSR